MMLVGIVLLLAGAEALVRGSVALAGRAGVPPLIVGLTLVSIGTSAPEVMVTGIAAVEGSPGVAMGNVVGSNIFNILGILGIAALFGALHVSRAVIRRDIPLLMAVSLLVLGLAGSGVVARGEGLLLLVLAFVYTLHLAGAALREDVPPIKPAGGGVLRELFMAVGGIAALAVGAHWLVRGAVDLAGVLAVPEHLVGVTIVAAGTSLPELATTVAAARRGEGDLAVGNIVGSNLYNLLLVLGAGAMLSPTGLPVEPSAITFDLPLMLVAAFALLPFAATGFRIDRWEGVVFLVHFVAYVGVLVASALGHAVPDLLFLIFLIPLTVITIGIVGIRVRNKVRSSE